MPKFNLKINNQNVPIPDTVRLNKTLLSIDNISTRGVRFSNVFNVPYSNEVNEILEYPSDLNGDSLAFETSHTYSLESNNAVVSTGTVLVKQFSRKKGIRIQLVEGFNFWNSLGSAKMNDLDLARFDYVFNTANIETLRANTGVLISANHDSSGKGINTPYDNDLYNRPMYRHKGLLDEILVQYGYTYNNELFDSSLLDRMGELSNSDRFLVSDYKRSYSNVVVDGVFSLSNGVLSFSKAGNTTVSGDNIINSTIKTSYSLKGWVISSSDTYLSFISGSIKESVFIPQGRTFINFNSSKLEINRSTYIYSESPITLESVDFRSVIDEGDIFDITNIISIQGYLALCDLNLPNRTVKSFIKNLMSICFIDLNIDELTKEVSLVNLNDIINTSNTTDVSDININDLTIKSGNMYAQLNEMKYDNDEDVGVFLGSHFFKVDNKSAKEKGVFMSISEYSASKEELINGYSAISFSLYDNVENKRSSVKNRIVYFENGGIMFNAVFSPLSMRNIHDRSYFSFIEATKRERSIPLEVYLNIEEYNQLNNKPIIFVEQLSSTYLVLSVNSFDNRGLCRLDVLKYN